MSNAYQLIWFRQDLRIHDHAALWHATQAGPCIAICILSLAQWQRHDDAAIKIDFYLRQLQALEQELKALNIPLIIQSIDLWKDIPDYFNALLQEIQIENIFANIEFGVNELKRDKEVQALFNSQKKKFQKMTGGQAVVRSLKAEKVEHMFGLIGSATIEMFDALYHEKDIKFIGVRDERTGTHMADGYALSLIHI